MPKFKFTKTALNAIQPPEPGKRSIYYDTDTAGLALRVTALNTKAYYFVRRLGHKKDWFRLGTFPDMTPEQARNAAQRLQGEYACGLDPAEIKRNIKAMPTLAEFFDEQYMPVHGAAKASGKQDNVRFRKWITPKLGSRKLSDISKVDIAGLLRVAQSANLAVATVKQIRALISVILSKAVEFGFIDTNPALGLKVTGRTVKRERFLQPQEMKVFLDALVDEEPRMRDLILIALLTGARRGNVMAMRWQDIDFEQKVWHIERTKDGTPQTVVLSPEAIKVLEIRKSYAKSDFVFPSKSKSGHIQEPYKGFQRVLKRAGLVYGRNQKSGIVFHDLRRTLGSWQARTGASLVIIGKSLNHKNPSTTMIYARLDQDPVREAVETATTAMLEAGRA